MPESVKSNSPMVKEFQAFAKRIADHEKETIRIFCEEVNVLACQLMEESGKLEGMHRAAIVRICKERGIQLSEGFGGHT